MDTNTQQPKPTQIQPLTQDQSSSAAWKSDVQLWQNKSIKKSIGNGRQQSILLPTTMHPKTTNSNPRMNNYSCMETRNCAAVFISKDMRIPYILWQRWLIYSFGSSCQLPARELQLTLLISRHVHTRIISVLPIPKIVHMQSWITCIFQPSSAHIHVYKRQSNLWLVAQRTDSHFSQDNPCIGQTYSCRRLNLKNYIHVRRIRSTRSSPVLNRSNTDKVTIFSRPKLSLPLSHTEEKYLNNISTQQNESTDACTHYLATKLCSSLGKHLSWTHGLTQCFSSLSVTDNS